MIIKLSPNEVKNFVAIALGLSGTPFDLEIVENETAVLAALRTALTENPRFSSDQKIPAIKRFRELCPQRANSDCTGMTSTLSLSDAKWAVENVREAISNLETSGNIRKL